MRAVVWFALLVAGCYQNPALDSTCKVRCTGTCPAGQSCVNGYCVGPGDTCGDGGVAGDGSAAATACAVEVALGRRHGCMRKADGTVWCSGRNDDGQLGNGSTGPEVSTPVQVSDDAGPLTGATTIAASADTTCAVRSGGEVWCWGDGSDGEVGDNMLVNSSTAKRVVTSGGGPLTNIVEIEGGYAFFCARDSAAGVWCWGYGANGRLGDNGGVTRGAAVRVLDASFVPINNAAELTVGHFHACLRTQANEIKCWGRNGEGELGTGTFTDGYVASTSIATAISVAAGSLHTCVLNADTTMTCFGDNWHDRLGFPAGSNVTSPMGPVLEKVGGFAFSGVTAIAAGGSACALTTAGAVVCWGHSTHGQAGASSIVPQAILTTDGTPLVNATSVYTNFAQACATRADGILLCWGRNTEGQLGIGTFQNTSLATPLRLTCP